MCRLMDSAARATEDDREMRTGQTDPSVSILLWTARVLRLEEAVPFSNAVYAVTLSVFACLYERGLDVFVRE